MGYECYILINEDLGWVIKLEVEKKELELKLKIVWEVMSEYILRLNDKVSDMWFVSVKVVMIYEYLIYFV